MQLTEHDALGAHLRDELGIIGDELAKPFQAAWSSAVAFSVGAAIPLHRRLAGVRRRSASPPIIAGHAASRWSASGYTGARLGGAKPGRPIARVVIGGAIAMAVTMLVGKLFGAAVS